MPILKERQVMKILKIEHGKGFFLNLNNNEWTPIDKIDKNDLLRLLNKFLEEKVEMDPIENDNLRNQAHQIIYNSIHEKFRTLQDNKTKFRDESDRLYLEEIRKYDNN